MMKTLGNNKKNWVKPELKNFSIKNYTLSGTNVDKEAGGAKRAPKQAS